MSPTPKPTNHAETNQSSKLHLLAITGNLSLQCQLRVGHKLDEMSAAGGSIMFYSICNIV